MGITIDILFNINPDYKHNPDDNDNDVNVNEDVYDIDSDDENDENDENTSNICLSMKYELDEYLLNIIRKYRCSIEAPYYDVRSDTILFILKINMLGLTKSIKLLNMYNNKYVY